MSAKVASSQHRVVVLNSLSGLLPMFVELGVAFVMSPVMVHGLGNRDYGIWELLVGLVGYMGVLDLGLGPALVRYVARAEGKGDVPELNRVFNTGLFALTGAGFLGLLVLAVLALEPGWVFGVGASEGRRLSWLLVIFGINLLIALPKSAIGALLLGLQKHRFLNLFRVVVRLIESVVVYIILTRSYGDPLILISAWTAISTALQGGVYLVWILAGHRELSIAVSSIDRRVLAEMVGFGFKNSVLFASASLVRRLIVFVVSHFAGVGAVVFYAIPFRLIEYAQGPTLALGTPLTPMFASLSGAGDMSSARTLWLRSTRFLQVVALGAPLALVWLGEPFIRRWMGVEYGDRAGVPLLILTASAFVQGVSPGSNRLLVSFARHGIVARFAALAAPIAFLVSIPLTKAAGLAGAALAATLYVGAVECYQLLAAHRALDLSVRQGLRETLIRFLVPLGATSVVFWAARAASYPETYGGILLQGVLGGALYLALSSVLVLDSEDRSLIRSILRARW